MHKGMIGVAPYDDGSGFRVEVKFDTTGDTGKRDIWLEASGSGWVTIPAEHVLELCDALKTAALYIERTTPAKEGIE
jgi:hypothetical protein